MSTETLTQTIGVGATIEFGGGTNFLILTSTGPVDVTAIRLGSSSSRIVLRGALQGFNFKSEDGQGFDLLQVTSATAQNVTFVVGNDDVSYPSTVNVAGSVNTIPQPASAAIDQGPVVTVANVQTALFPENVSRKRITAQADTNNVGTVFFRVNGGTGKNVGFIAPGQSWEFDGTYAIDYFDASAGDKVYLFEEQ